MAKITRATFKSFVRKNPNLLIRVESSFDGMVDMVTASSSAAFRPAVPATYTHDNNLGIKGIWLTGGSRAGDRFEEFSAPGLRGISVSNCCGSFTVAVRV